jgi:glucosamine-6-phosphate deaminase
MPLAAPLELSSVEKAFLFGNESSLPSDSEEKLRLVEVQNVYELGKLVTLSFIEWIKDNPSGLIALPTGKSPEYFIK